MPSLLKHVMKYNIKTLQIGAWLDWLLGSWMLAFFLCLQLQGGVWEVSGIPLVGSGDAIHEHLAHS